MRYEELVEESKDTTFRETKDSMEVLDRLGNTVYSKNIHTGFERFMRYDSHGRLICYSDSNDKVFNRDYTPVGVVVTLKQC